MLYRKMYKIVWLVAFDQIIISIRTYQTIMASVWQVYPLYSTSKSTSSHSSRMIALITLLSLLSSVHSTGITDNTCTFKIDGKLFSLAYLNKNARSQQNYYSAQHDNHTIEFNFCEPFVPKQCADQKLPYAYSYVINRTMLNKDEPQKGYVYNCMPYSSDSRISDYQVNYTELDGDGLLNMAFSTAAGSVVMRQTRFMLECDEATNQALEDIQIDSVNQTMLVIKGESAYACPIFTMQSIWQALASNRIIFGILLLIIGFIMLFYGVLMIHLMVFLATYFLSFAALLGIFSAFLNPESSRAIIYFSLLFILFLSTLIAYGLARMVNFSIFFIGAFFGLILGALVNTVFTKLFSVYSIWSLIFFEVIFTIPLGLLTFKYNKQIIILSTSLAGAYMIVRPFSWIFGGFPNEFTLYQSIQEGSANALSWTFFIYLVFIFAIFALGAHYQLLKIARKNNDTDQVNYLPGAMQDQLDLIHQHVQNLINKYSKSDQARNEQYTKMQASIPSNVEVRPASRQRKTIELQAIELQAIKRKSKQNEF